MLFVELIVVTNQDFLFANWTRFCLSAVFVCFVPIQFGLVGKACTTDFAHERVFWALSGACLFMFSAFCVRGFVLLHLRSFPVEEHITAMVTF